MLVALLALGVLCTAVAFLVFFALIREVGPARALVITYINPVVALFAGVLVLDEPLTVGTLVSLTLILIGSVLATRRAAPPSAAPAEAERP
ncbi:EamA family transporter [Mycolicibacterium phlei]|uniref:EamA family transporter n=1 Tax=Mycolicibacterium phlei TaxID=1771 RepID=UPI0037C9467A